MLIRYPGIAKHHCNQISKPVPKHERCTLLLVAILKIGDFGIARIKN